MIALGIGVFVGTSINQQSCNRRVAELTCHPKSFIKRPNVDFGCQEQASYVSPSIPRCNSNGVKPFLECRSCLAPPSKSRRAVSTQPYSHAST